MKKLLLLNALLVSFVSSISAMDLTIDQEHICASTALGALKVLRTAQGFSVLKDDEIREVKSYDVEPVLRKMSKEQLMQALVGTKIKVTQLSNEDYKLNLIGGLKGGGAGGATAGFWIGRFVTQTVGYGIVALVALPALAGGPIAYSVVATGLAGTCAPLIESASHVVAIGTAIVVGAGTGPV